MVDHPRFADPDLERGRAAAAAVKARGGSAMEAALAFIDTAFDETARARRLEQRRRIKPIWKLSDAELEAIANSDSDDQEAAIQELDERVRDRIENPHDDTPCIEWNGWNRPGEY